MYKAASRAGIFFMGGIVYQVAGVLVGEQAT